MQSADWDGTPAPRSAAHYPCQQNHDVPLDLWATGATRRTWPLARRFGGCYGYIGARPTTWYPTLAEDNHRGSRLDGPPFPGIHAESEFVGATIKVVQISLGDDAYLDLEREFQAAMARD